MLVEMILILFAYNISIYDFAEAMKVTPITACCKLLGIRPIYMRDVLNLQDSKLKGYFNAEMFLPTSEDVEFAKITKQKW